jgi:hypothetical protein
MTTFQAAPAIGAMGGGMRDPLVTLFTLAAWAVLPIETGQPQSRFALGSVDLVALAASMPPIESAAPAQPEPERPPTCRELHARVEAFRTNDVGARVASQRARLIRAEKGSAVSSGENVSDSLSALFVVLLGTVSHATSTDVRNAKACLSILDGYDARVRALRDDVPETDTTAPAGLLERWERIAAEFGEKTRCGRGR